MNEKTFWVVRKMDLESKVERHDSNPVKTSYELLWAEVRRPDRSTLTIQVTTHPLIRLTRLFESQSAGYVLYWPSFEDSWIFGNTHEHNPLA